MRSGGLLPEDAPDPRLSIIEQLRTMPIPILGLVPQPHIEDWGSFGAETERRNGVIDHMAAVISYTLWRNPAERDDPANLAELDDAMREALEARPPWPRPRWLVEQVERMRYPMLWEAVRTTWHSSDADRPTAAQELARHVRQVLVNRHHTQWARDPGGRDDRLQQHLDQRQVEHDVPVIVNGTEVSGVRIDTAPFVLGLGADLGTKGLLTAVVDREALPYITLEFATRRLDGAQPAG